MTEHVLEQPQPEVSAIQPHFSGTIIGLQGDVLHGWAMDNTQQERRPIVEIFIDGASVALARADQYEPSAPAGDQFHGFAVQLRQRWLDEARSITAQIANQPFLLNGQLSLPVTPSEDNAGIASQVWHNGGLRVAGWCWDPESPNRHVEVTVREGDRVICKVTCDEHNQALVYRGSSEHGFSIDLPWEMADGKLHVLEIVNDFGQTLAGSPIRLCCRPEGIEGLLHQLNAADDSPMLALLKQIAKEQTLRLPNSASWQHYPQWFEAFQRLDTQPTPDFQGALGLLVLSDDGEALEQINLSSLGCCRTDVHKTVTSTPDDLLPALTQLLESGCDRVLPVTAGDHLAPMALAQLSALLDDGSAWAYADCDRDGPQGERSVPWLKPVWDIDLFIGADIFSPGAIYSASILKQAVTLLNADGVQRSINWHDLAAGVALATENSNARVTHLPQVLYHRGSHTAASPEQAQPCPQRYQALVWLCEQLAPGAQVSQVAHYPALFRAHWPLPAQLPRVSLIVPTRDQYELLKTCIEGLLNNTDYPNLEIIVVDNQSTDPQTLAYIADIKRRGVKVIDHPYPFNYSTINNRAAKLATGELIGLINNDIEIIESDWLKEMVSHALRPGIGAVGAKLLWPNRMVQHGGVVVGVNSLAAHTGNNLNQYDAGYLGTNQITKQQSAVTAACLVMRKTLFDSVKGLDERAFPVAFNDVDLCLRIQQFGLRNIWTAFAQLIHAESASRGKDVSPEKRARAQREQQRFTERWATRYTDPYYHPALSLDYLAGPYGGLSLPPAHEYNAPRQPPTDMRQTGACSPDLAHKSHTHQ
ncbi:glycosyltransferase [Pseudomonas sp. DE0010]|uniref:glycosyltransferase family 2 protein n=1 Tax=Pseudomonas sp. DE0010 TaxID=2584951 RepID=UPI0011A7CAAA|nr:glycosyltransferase family 2 protein [Pseudomonas sp. DE0010]